MVGFRMFDTQSANHTETLYSFLHSGSFDLWTHIHTRKNWSSFLAGSFTQNYLRMMLQALHSMLNAIYNFGGNKGECFKNIRSLALRKIDKNL